MNDLKCNICNMKFEDNSIINKIYINGKLSSVCNNCLNNFIIDNDIELEIYVVNNNKKYLLNIINYDLFKKYGIYIYDGLYMYNNIYPMDYQYKKSIYDFLLKFYGGKKYILKRFNIDNIDDFYIKINKTYNFLKCSICGKKIDYGVYFFKKGKNISVVCKECNDLMYRKENINKKGVDKV